MTVTTTIVDVTPETAREWLKANTRNRHLRDADVERYARDMREGRWQFTAEPIKFGLSGVLLDGQHRLHAIARAGVTVKALVVFGLEDDAQHVMDTGAKRTVADALNLTGVKNAALCAAGARLALLWESGRLFRDSKHQVVSTAEVEEWLREHPEFHDAVTRAAGYRHRIDCQPSVVVAAYWRLSQVHADRTAEFFHGLAELTNLEPGNPILALHRRLTDLRRTRTSQRDLLALFILAWNRWRQGRSVTRLHVPQGRWTAENFPTPI